MENKIPDFVLVYKGMTYVVIGEDFILPELEKDPLIRKPRRLE